MKTLMIAVIALMMCSLPAQAECLTKPGRSHNGWWHYRVDRTSHQRCWYLAKHERVRKHKHQDRLEPKKPEKKLIIAETKAERRFREFISPAFYVTDEPITPPRITEAALSPKPEVEIQKVAEQPFEEPPLIFGPLPEKRGSHAGAVSIAAGVGLASLLIAILPPVPRRKRWPMESVPR